MAHTGPAHRGIFGGTFDPIHLGHTAAVRQVMVDAELDEVRVIPTSVPPHREPPVASVVQRFDMVSIALSGEPGMVPDARELERPGTSYTVDTVAELCDEYPDSRFSIILGLDAALAFEQWHRWRDLLGMAGIIAMARPGWSLPDPLPPWWQVAEPGNPSTDSTGRIRCMAISPMDISASGIRAGLRAGLDMSDRLHPGVFDYIREHRLYTPD